jgi:hypothetical protein
VYEFKPHLVVTKVEEITAFMVCSIDVEALALCQPIQADLAGSSLPQRAALQEVSLVANKFEVDHAR